MALATQCPHCGTMFRVAADQLKLRGGIVRCGACTEIFDGNAALVDLAAAGRPSPAPRRRRVTDAAVPPTPAPSAAPEPQAPAALPAPAQEADEEPIYTLEFDRTFSPYGILPKLSSEADSQDPAPLAAPQPAPAVEASPAPPLEASPEAPPAPPDAAQEAAPAAAPEAAPEPAPATQPQAEEEPVAAPVSGHDGHAEEPAAAVATAAAVAAPAPAPAAAPVKAAFAAPPLLLRESGPATVTMPAPPSAPPLAPRTPRAKAAEARAARKSKLTPTKIEPPRLRVPEPDEPEFVRRGRQRERSGKAMRIAMIAGSVLLLLALAAQAVMHFGSALAARHPGLKPGLVSLCGVLGCRIGLPARIEQLVIDTGELTTHGGNAYTFSTQLRNQGDSAQAWPSIELTLSDADDRPLVRRVFGPRDYLPAGPLLAAGFAAHAEQPVKLHFRVAEVAPSGYHVAVFYP